MIDIDELFSEVLPHAPNVPEPIAIRYIRETAQHFCEKTRIWREWDEMEITGDNEGDGITTLQDAQIYRIEEARIEVNGAKIDLEPQTTSWLDDEMPGWKFDYDEVEAPPCYITQVKPNQVMVVPKAIGTLKVRLVLLPSRKAETLPDFLVDRYAAQIGKGAAGRILLLPRTEFENPTLGAGFVQDFEHDLKSIVREIRKTQLNAPQRTKPSFF